MPTIHHDDMKQFENRVVEAIDASMEFFNILQYSEQDIKDAAVNITDALERKDHDLTYRHVDDWVCGADRMNYDLPNALQQEAIAYIDWRIHRGYIVEGRSFTELFSI